MYHFHEASRSINLAVARQEAALTCDPCAEENGYQ